MANSLMRFDPFGDIASFDPFRTLDDMFNEIRMLPSLRAAEAPRIRMDVTEDDKSYLVMAEIPGVKKDDIKVAIDGNQVSISAEVKENKELKGPDTIRCERTYGQQFRSFTLPIEVDHAAADARYENGVLHLVLPKKPGTASAKQIKIQ